MAMKTSDFIKHLDEPRIIEEIKKAEAGTSGEIRVFVSTREIDDPVAQAKRHFEDLGMTKTRHRNGVLIYLAPRSRKFAILGDKGIHEKSEQSWEDIVAAVVPLLREDRFTEAICRAIHETGALLARHFPAEPGDRNELPNTIASETSAGADDQESPL
jgi:uncharacterized membrane protein